jgi:ABC-type Fe3+/spermidine/putrescine transport system ATPase subunit
MTTLSLRGLGRRFGTHQAVDNVDLELRSGEFVSLLGPSGCGKTTTLRMIAGFIEPTAGTIALDGKVLSDPKSTVPPEHRGMSMIFQSYAIWPNMTVAQNVAFGLKLRKLQSAEIKERVDRILEVVRMKPLAERYPAELSGGQQQRVSLARAIVVQPSVLLLDEPLSNLDATLREEMRFEIRRMHDEFKITTIYVTHDQAEAMVTSDRIAVMNAGRIEQVDDPFTLYNRPRTRFVSGFVGRTNFLSARRADGRTRFDGFDLPDEALGFRGGDSRNRMLFSIRPHNIKLHACRPADGRDVVLECRVLERAFLGETWDYKVGVGGDAMRLTVSARPSAAFARDSTVWLAFDPANLIPVEDERKA